MVGYLTCIAYLLFWGGLLDGGDRCLAVLLHKDARHIFRHLTALREVKYDVHTEGGSLKNCIIKGEG